MIYGSFATGLASDHLAWAPLGWRAAWHSEIDKFCRELLRLRTTDVPNLGDFTADDFCDRAREAGEIDLLAGGTPCQAFSVAGKRRSLEDARGNLTLRFCEVADELGPDVVVWENVPGVLSTRDNAFGCLLGKLVGSGGALCSGRNRGRWPGAGVARGPRRALAWRVLDAQHFGVAQRRRRVVLVAVRAGAGPDPAAVLLEPDCVRRDSPPGREEGEEVAGMLAPGAHPGSGCNRESVAHSLRGEGFDASEDGTGRGTPLVAFSAKDCGADAGELAPTLRAMSHDGSHANGGGQVAVAYQVFAHDSCAKERHAKPADVARPVDSTGAYVPGQGGTLAFTERLRAGGRTLEAQEDLAYALTNPGSGGRTHSRQILDAASRVRRLTPRECERLQGMPDDWTLIPWRGKPAEDCPDGLRYRAIGNAWAVPVFAWLGRRIEKALAGLGGTA